MVKIRNKQVNVERKFLDKIPSLYNATKAKVKIVKNSNNVALKLNFPVLIFIYLNKAFIKIHLGILSIIVISSKKLLLLDKNFITDSADVSNIL